MHRAKAKAEFRMEPSKFQRSHTGVGVFHTGMFHSVESTRWTRCQGKKIKFSNPNCQLYFWYLFKRSFKLPHGSYLEDGISASRPLNGPALWKIVQKPFMWWFIMMLVPGEETRCSGGLAALSTRCMRGPRFIIGPPSESRTYASLLP